MVASIERYRALAKHSQDRLFVAGARQNGWPFWSCFARPALFLFLTDQVVGFVCLLVFFAYGECVWMCIDWCELFCFGWKKTLV